MKNKSKLSLSLVYLCSVSFFCFPAWAQTAKDDVFNHPLSPQTTSAFNATCSRLSKHQFVTGQFKQERIIARSERSLKSSGNFVIAAEMGMVWDTLSPVSTTITLGSDYIIQARGKRRTVTSAQGNEIFLRTAEVLSMIFTGNARGLLENFEVYFSGNEAQWELGLIPTNSIINSYMKHIIMKGNSDITHIQIHENSGDVVTYVLSNHKYPAQLSSHENAYFVLP